MTYLQVEAVTGAHPVVAGASAAYEVAVDQYQGQVEQFDAELSRRLKEAEDATRIQGVAAYLQPRSVIDR